MEELGYDSLDIASYIKKKCQELNYSGINNTKIQKLLYCCYGATLVIENKRLCKEYPRAWNYGPVFPKVYSYISKNKKLEDISQVSFPDNIKNILDTVIAFFGKFSGGQLSQWSHEEGSPWYNVITLQKQSIGSFIPDEDILEYFKRYVVIKNDNDQVCE